MTNEIYTPKLGNVVIPGTHPKIGHFMQPDLPVTAGLKAMYIHGGSVDLSIRNRADNSAPLTLVGSPEIASGFGAVCGYGKCFDTGKVSTKNQTHIVICKPVKPTAATDTQQAFMMGNYSYSGAPAVYRGDGLAFLFSGQSLYGAFVEDNGATPLNMINYYSAAYDTSKWAAFVELVDGDNGIARIAARQGGTLNWQNSKALTNRTAYTDRTIRIGSHHAPAAYPAGANITMGMELIFDVALTQAQVASVLDSVSAYLTAAWLISDV
ncbi:hypothetical protein KC248_00860 [Klebsiella michiganensis]|uniref:hypothetical protein n=1 Tax=Klebsiella michiganensis TaxID=1134687 RepID=UPI001B839740|nr:hypothetical protein [Klebsiella michiganensis]MBR7529914.1 hypothetical protein [Klebsiella michiganensis]MBR7569299.1 hypothetical protein [Klebsiella michiganensis]